MMIKTIVAVGAYGRKASKLDWISGKDFRIVGGPYFSSSDGIQMAEDGYERIVFMDGHKKVFEVML